MPWFYVDDGFSDSKPVLNMPDRYRLAACGLWVLGGSWSAKEELDGFVPDSKLRQLGVRPPILAALTEPGPMSSPLCERVEGGIQFNSWGKWQKTRAELNAKRREDAERQRLWREANPDAKPTRKPKGRNAVSSTNDDASQCDTPVTDSVTNTVTDDGVTDVSRCDPTRAQARGPDPTRPDPYYYSSNEEHSPNVGGDERGLTEPIEPSASRLVATLIPDTIPAAVRTGLRIRASELMRGDGLDSDTVAETLRRWLVKPGAGVGLLASIASDVVRERAAPASNGRAPNKLRALAGLAAEVRANEQAQITNLAQRRAIE